MHPAETAAMTSPSLLAVSAVMSPATMKMIPVHMSIVWVGLVNACAHDLISWSALMSSVLSPSSTELTVTWPVPVIVALPLRFPMENHVNNGTKNSRIPTSASPPRRTAAKSCPASPTS